MLTERSRWWRAVAAVVLAAASPASAGTQPSVALDASVSTVAFDGYLRSLVASLAPSARLEAGALSFEARGILSRFESGRMSAQGLAGGRWLSPVRGAFRGELRASGGTSWYADLAPSLSGLDGEARVHATTTGRGVWVSGGGARIATQVGSVHSTRIGAGAWTRAGPGSLALSAVHVSAGQGRYTDSEARARWPRGPLELVVAAGARSGASSSDAARGGASRWLALTVRWRLTRRASLLAAAGRYPPDVAAGTPGAAYATFGLRLASRGYEPTAERSLLPATGLAVPRGGIADDSWRATEDQFVVRGLPDGVTALEMTAPHARIVEAMGGFTDWSPVPFTRDADGVWRLRTRLSSGAHRLNVRVDGGAWTVPPGLASVADDFGGAAGLVLIP